MKKKTYFIFIIIILFCLPFTTIAEERNFPAGSLIIPMDSFYQEEADGGILEAYGLVFYLLSHQSLNEHFDMENDITVYWIIDDQKVEIDADDFAIQDSTAGTVASLYDHAGGDSALTFKPGHNINKIAYSGAPFVIDGTDAVAAKTVIDQAGWSAVDVHVAQVPFAAPVYREMIGTPPKIALMNDSEDDTGNAQILESYLRLAGICSDVFDTVTPNDIRDNILVEEHYDFLWTPHWTGYDKYTDDNNGNSVPDVEDIVIKISEFVKSGKGVLAECASIEVFEHSQNGRFLSTKGIGHNEGTDDPDDMIFLDTSSPNPQAGDFAFDPEGGHIHNWRPFHDGDDYKFDDRPDELPAGDPEVTAGNPSAYVDTVSRFITDNADDNTAWDYYVGGYAYGDTKNGYVVYLGGHKYAECADSAVEPDFEANVHEVLFEFDKEISTEVFTLDIGYDTTSNTSITFDADDLTAKSGNPLEIDLTTAKIEKTKDGGKLNNVTFRNLGSSLMTINDITVSWTGGDGGQKLKKVEDLATDIKHLDKGDLTSPAPVPIDGSGFTLDLIPGGDGVVESCTDNSDCTWKNIAGVRFVLNTLFNIKFQIKSYEYVRSAPVVQHPYLYQGSFEYPSYFGHFRRHNVETEDSIANADWNTQDTIKDALEGNSSTNARQVFTSRQDDDDKWVKIAFDADNIDLLNVPLDITPDDGDNDDEIDVINRLRGKEKNRDGEVTELTYKLGGIMHSAPAIVTQNSRTGSIGSNRTETAYVGDVYGMLHAIDISTGREKWAFIPNNLLEKLQNNRIDPNAVQNFAAVDGSPTARDVYYDHDNDPDTDEVWRTILICSEGMGGSHIFALDVTDPDNFSVLWEVTDLEAPGKMGHSFRVSIGRVKSPVYKADGISISHYVKKWMVFTATGFLDYDPHGGINVFAFDLKTGEKVWNFSSQYSDSINDIPGSITLYDTSGDTFVDRIFVGDMNGRLWELNALDGDNPHGIVGGDPDGDNYGKQIPLWNAGIGNPISVSPAVVRYNPLVVIFGTGGADWASTADDKRYSVYAVNASDLKTEEATTYDDGAGTLLWEVTLNAGEKVWSAPTVAANTIFIATATGTMEGSEPVDDQEGTGRLLAIKLAPDDDDQVDWTIDDIGKARGSLYIDRQHIYLTTNDRTIKQIGDGDFTDGNPNMTVLRAWKLK